MRLIDREPLTFHNAIPVRDQQRQHLAMHRRLDEAVTICAIHGARAERGAPNHGLPTIAQHTDAIWGVEHDRIKGGRNAVHNNGHAGIVMAHLGENKLTIGKHRKRHPAAAR